MPHLSRRKLNQKTEKLIGSALVWAFSRLKENEANYVFESLLSPTEKLMLAKRLGIIFLLNENSDETTISETLKVTQATVSRIKFQHKHVSQNSSSFLLHKLNNWHDFNLFKGAIKEIGINALKTFSRGMAGKV